MAVSPLRSTGSPREFHERPVPTTVAVWVHDLTASALVLGSSQDIGDVDQAACAAVGLDVVRRRSGGGAVLLLAGDVGWVDVIVPRGSVGDDVLAPMVDLGTAFAEALSSCGVDEVTVSTVTRATAWSSVVCFDGLGPGEVSVGGSKAVGISQRRTRDTVRLQCAWYHRVDPDEIRRFLTPRARPPAGALAPIGLIDRQASSALVAAAAEWASTVVGGGQMGKDG